MVIVIFRAMGKEANSSLSFRGHQKRAVFQGKTSINAGIATFVNLDAGMGLTRGERCERVKKESCLKK